MDRDECTSWAEDTLFVFYLFPKKGELKHEGDNLVRLDISRTTKVMLENTAKPPLTKVNIQHTSSTFNIFKSKTKRGADNVRFQTHVATSIAAGSILAKVISLPFTIGYVAGIALGSLLPDIDEPKSYIGRRVPILPQLIKKKFGHRGFTHSLLAWIFISLIYVIYPSPLTYGIWMGYLFHILGDFFSVSGVPLFFPFDKQRKKALFTYKTSSVEEVLIFYAAILIATYWIIFKGQLEPFIQSTIQCIEAAIKILLRLFSS